jgi:hypothetical protein
MVLKEAERPGGAPDIDQLTGAAQAVLLQLAEKLVL